MESPGMLRKISVGAPESLAGLRVLDADKNI